MVHEEKVLSGFVSKIGPLGVFVKFLNGLTALAPRANISDEWVSDPNKHFNVGQTVQAKVVHVNEKLRKFIVTLKASALCAQPQADQLYIQSFFSEEQQIAEAKTKKKKKNSPSKRPSESCRVIGEVCSATVFQLKEYGLILKFEDGESLGFCMNENAPTEIPKLGTKVECRVLDVEPSKGIIDVSLRKSIVDGGHLAPKKVLEEFPAKKECKIVVELLKPSHAVVSLTEFSNALALVPLRDYNGKMPGLEGLTVGLKCRAVPTFRNESDTSLLETYKEMPILKVLSDASLGQKKIRQRAESYSSERVEIGVGSIVRVQVRDIHKTIMNVTLLNVKKRKRFRGCIATIHSTNVIDPMPDSESNAESVFSPYSVGSIFQAKIIEIKQADKENKKGRIEVCLSARQSELKVSDGSVVNTPEMTWDTLQECGPSNAIVGYVNKVKDDGILVDLSRYVKGFLFCTSISENVDLLDKLFNQKNSEHFHAGMPIKVKVVSVDAQARRADLVLA